MPPDAKTAVTLNPGFDGIDVRKIIPYPQQVWIGAALKKIEDSAISPLCRFTQIFRRNKPGGHAAKEQVFIAGAGNRLIPVSGDGFTTGPHFVDGIAARYRSIDPKHRECGFQGRATTAAKAHYAHDAVAALRQIRIDCFRCKVLERHVPVLVSVRFPHDTVGSLTTSLIVPDTTRFLATTQTRKEPSTAAIRLCEHWVMQLWEERELYHTRFSSCPVAVEECACEL